MERVILIDADGVVIAGRHKYFSDRLSEEKGIPKDDILAFFKNEYGSCSRGKADIKEVILPYLQKWNWEGSVEDFLTYWFEGENQVDSALIEAIDELRSRGVKTYIVSDNEKYRAEYLMDACKLADHFDGTFFSYAIGYKKSEPEFFKTVLERLPNEAVIEYWDDDPENVDVAERCGIKSYVYRGIEEFKSNVSY